MLDKSELRQALIARRALAFQLCPDAGEQLVAHFPFPISKQVIVAGYMPFRAEIDPLPLLRWLMRQGAQLTLPRMNSPSHLWGGVGVGGGATDTITTTVPHPPTPSPQVGRGEALMFHRCDVDEPNHFQKNKWGLLEPRADLPTATPTILLVPLLGFDRQGNRLGYGKGYYDATIQALKSQGPLTTIGVAFAQQEVPEIPTQLHDQRLDWIITQNEAYPVPS